MESKQLNYNNTCTLLERVDSWYKKNANNKSYEHRFDVKSDVCWLKFRVVQAIERIIKTNLECDRELTEDDFENFKRFV